MIIVMASFGVAERGTMAGMKDLIIPEGYTSDNGFNWSKARLIANYLRRGLGRRNACAQVGVSWTTFQRFFRGNEAFRAMIEHAEKMIVEDVEQSLLAAAMGGSVPAQTFFLQNRAAKRWRKERSLANLSDEELSKLLQGHFGVKPDESSRTVDTAFMPDPDLEYADADSD